MRTLVLFYAFGLTMTAADLRVGIIGTDTSHATAFTKILNDPTAQDHVAGAHVVAAYQGGSADIEESRSRVEKYAAELRDKWQVKIVGTIPELCGQVDALMLNSIDGRVHLAQAREALTWGPGPLEEHHKLDLTWYAIHPIEILYTLMGQGCEEVTRISTADADVMVGRWKGGRIGTVRALRPYGDYGAVVYRKGAKSQKSEVSTKVDGGYAPLVREVVEFFEGGKPPVSNDETLEMFAFMDAAQ